MNAEELLIAMEAIEPFGAERTRIMVRDFIPLIPTNPERVLEQGVVRVPCEGGIWLQISFGGSKTDSFAVLVDGNDNELRICAYEFGVLNAEAAAVRFQPTRIPLDARGRVAWPIPDPQREIEGAFYLNISTGRRFRFSPGAQEKTFREAWGDNLTGVQVDVLLILALLNCRNITLVDDPVDYRTTRQERRRRQRCGELTSLYKVLAVAAQRPKVKWSREDRASTLILTRSHFVRGHMKTYTEDAPLYGKYVGQWWWCQHERGDDQQGTITKGYEVVPCPVDDAVEVK